MQKLLLNTDRKTMAKVLWMLRKAGFIATELSGIQKLPPLDFFEQLKADNLNLHEKVSYNNWPKRKVKFGEVIYPIQKSDI